MAQQDHFGPTCEIISKGEDSVGDWVRGVEGRGGDGMFLLASCVTWLKWYRLAVTISTMIRMVRIDGIFLFLEEKDHAQQRVPHTSLPLGEPAPRK
jgi:hypothetical protein